MKRITTLFACAAAGLAIAGTPAFADDHSDESEASAEMTKGEKKLARLLEGRVAGEPTTCIRSRFNDRLQIINDTAYVYGRGKTIYVQRTKSPEQIDDDDILVSRRFDASQICKMDIVTTADRSFGMFSGVIFFDDFIPYTRVDEDKQGS